MDTNKKLKILTCQIGDQMYGLPVSVVTRVLRAVEITLIPTAPKIILGVINVGGEVVPVIDSPVFLNISQDKKTIQLDDCFILINYQSVNFILVADKIDKMIEHTHDDMSKLVQSTDEKMPCYSGMIKDNKHIIFIINVDHVLKSIKDILPTIAEQVPL